MPGYVDLNECWIGYEQGERHYLKEYVCVLSVCVCSSLGEGECVCVNKVCVYIR